MMYAGKTLYDVLQGSINESKFLQDCQIMSGLNHPNVTKFLGVCYVPNSRLPVLLMEKLERSLDDFIESSSIINPSFATKRSILEDIASGLVYLHQHDPPIIHRDLTARNILLTTELRAKIADFGQSRIVDYEPGQLPTRLPGTLVYMPPEAISSYYNLTLDIFSFGHLALYFALQVCHMLLLEIIILCACAWVSQLSNH